MKLVCSQNSLSANLTLVSRAVSSRPSHPILANILLIADEELQQIKLSAFDLSLGIQTIGGVVRDNLLGAPVNDIDLATRLTPDRVIAALEAAGIKAVPTGIAHGTITAVMPSGPVEITTLRR